MGRKVGYEDVGRGAPLVLIHGYPLNRTVWEAQWQGLSDTARVIAPDLRGFGESEMFAETSDIATYADDVRELLDALGVTEPATILGHSMGGYIALAYLRRYPQHVASLVLANTKMTPDSVEGKAGRDRGIATAKTGGAAAIADGMTPKFFAAATYTNNPALVEKVHGIMLTATVPGIVSALGSMRDRPDSSGTILESGTPILIIASPDDALMPTAEEENMREAAREGSLTWIPGTGHMTAMENPAAFNDAVRAFMRERKVK